MIDRRREGRLGCHDDLVFACARDESSASSGEGTEAHDAEEFGFLDGGVDGSVKVARIAQWSPPP